MEEWKNVLTYKGGATVGDKNMKKPKAKASTSKPDTSPKAKTDTKLKKKK